jgi:hypothetical protein
MTTPFEQAAAHVWTILSRLAADGTSGRYRVSLGADGEARFVSAHLDRGVAVRIDDDPAPPDVLLAFDVQDYLACAAGTRTLHQSAFEGRTRVRGNRQLALRFARAFAASVDGEDAPRLQSEEVPAPVPRRPCPPRPSEELAARRPHVAEVIRLERPDVEQFQREFVATGTPVILTGVLEEWELARWSPERLRAEHGDLLGIVRPGLVESGGPPHAGASIRDFAQLIDELEAPGGAAPRYLAYNELPAALSAAIRHPPYFPRSDYEDPPNIWLGPAGTVTHLHRDGTDNLFAQIWGSKRFTLYSPDQRPFLYAWATPAGNGLDGCDVDPDQPDYNRFPLFRQARKTECVVEAGELFFLPEGWFHHVRSLAPSLSVNFWTRTRR